MTTAYLEAVWRKVNGIIHGGDRSRSSCPGSSRASSSCQNKGKPQLTTEKSAIIKREYGKRGEVLKSLCKLTGREGSKSSFLPVAVAAIE